MHRPLIALGAVFGLTAVAMAALAAHALAWLDAGHLQMVRDAIQMQGWHALALVLTGIWVSRGGRLALWAGGAFALGTLLFCGDVYALAFGGLHLSVAPAGGVLLMAGWLLLGVSALRAR